MQSGSPRGRELGHAEKSAADLPAGKHLCVTFGSIIIFANPPLRGPDEIAHFLRIYSYARGELLPVTEIKARKGIFVSPELYNQLYFFKTAGEVFARAREEGVRYGQIMAEYSKLAGTHGDETEHAGMFAPFAGTEGYNPVAYFPYIVAAAIGRLLRLDFPTMLLLMRFFGLLALTAVAGRAGCGRSSLASWAGRIFCFSPGPISCSLSSSCSCRFKNCSWTERSVRA